MEASLHCLHLPSGFGGRAGSDVSTSHLFPQGVLAVITLVVDGAGDGGARARARYEPGLPLCSVANTTIWGIGSGPKLVEEKP